MSFLHLLVDLIEGSPFNNRQVNDEIFYIYQTDPFMIAKRTILN